MSCGVGHRCGLDPVLLCCGVGSCVAADLTLSMGTSMCHTCGPKNTKKKKNQKARYLNSNKNSSRENKSEDVLIFSYSYSVFLIIYILIKHATFGCY